MWSKVLQVAICWLTLSATFGKAENTVNNSIVKDNDSAESAPRLYRNFPIGVYASAAPYTAYSYHIPTILTAPRAAASRIIPVKEQLDYHNANGYLRDSYGNKFVGTPQTVAYKTQFPQQFVPLQELPPHLAQPLLATASHAKQAAPHYFVGHQYRAPTFQVAALSPTRSYGAFTQPIVFTENVNRFASASALPAAQYQPSLNKAVYTNTQSVEQFKNLNNEPQFQRLEQRPEVVQNNYDTSGATKQLDNTPIIQASPAQTSVTAIVNGKKTVFNLETKPPLPLLDLSLLEPLTFSKPQVQQFSPKNSEATYNKLPEINVNDAKQHKKEVVVQRTNSYDTGIIKGKPSSSVPKKKQKQGSRAQHGTPHHKQVFVKPTITVKGIPNQSPELSYEINSPNYKETYKEQSISYNKATDTDPVQYSYDKKTESKPINYSYHKTDHKEPVHYNVVRTSKEPVHIKQVSYQSNVQGPRQLIYKFKPEEQHDNQSETEDSSSSDNSGSSEDSGSAEVSDEEVPQQPRYYQEYEHNHEETPRHAQSQSNLRPEHREKYHQRPEKHGVHNARQHTPRHYSQPQKVPVTQSEPQFEPVQGYEENIQLSSPQTYSSPRPVQKDHHDSLRNPNPSVGPIYHHYAQQQSVQAPTPQPQLYNYGTPVIHEKAKRIIIQEESPDEVHSHREQITAEMIDQEDNNEEDFNRAYKNAAYGFPAYDKTHEDVEKDIYDPNTYGFTRDISSFDVEKSPFQQYQAPGDKFPKSARLSYKDDRDNNKEDYYLDYSISRPESLADRYSNKAEYYKLYKKQSPEKYFADEQNEKKQNRKEKYILSPSYDFQVGHQKKSSGYNLKYKEDPENHEYDYSKETPRDNSAYASRPYQRIKSKTHFVEPQFQYGFEPLALPRLLDSELATMASNDSPESEKPGLRKKVYKENWYIKKTSTSGGKPS